MPNLKWTDEFSSDNCDIDAAHKNIIAMAAKLENASFDGDEANEVIFQTAIKLADTVLGHMHLEIDLMKKLEIDSWKEHEASHNEYRKKFDLEQNHSLSPKMRVLMISEMVKDYMKKHFFIHDVPDLKKIRAKLREQKPSP